MRALTAESDMSTPTEEAKQIQPRSSPEALMYRNSGSLQLPVFVEQRLHEVAETLLEQGAVWYDAGPHGSRRLCLSLRFVRPLRDACIAAERFGFVGPFSSVPGMMEVVTRFACG